MKKPLHIIKTWFETGDVPTQEQFYDAWDSFHHKDNGQVITDKTVNTDGDVTFTFSDGQTLTIEKFIPDTSKPMEYIDGLVAQLNTIGSNITTLQNNKLDKINGKGLSEANYTQTEKDKLAGLENYNAPNSQSISFIAGLQDLLNQIQQDITLKVDKVDGKGLSSNDYTATEKNEVAKIDDKRDKNAPFNVVDDDGNDSTSASLDLLYPVTTHGLNIFRYTDEGEASEVLYFRKALGEWVRFPSWATIESLYSRKTTEQWAETVSNNLKNKGNSKIAINKEEPTSVLDVANTASIDTPLSGTFSFNGFELTGTGTLMTSEIDSSKKYKMPNGDIVEGYYFDVQGDTNGYYFNATPAFTDET
ncbi:MAG: hypothetical protein ACWIPI_04115, partial [Polaribacter sp.]